MLLRWGFLIMSIFAWCIYESCASPKPINCQRYVFHPKCRGSQAKKRLINLADNNEITEPSCVCPNVKKMNDDGIDSISSSKLLEALFDKGFDVNTIYDAYMATSDRRRDYNLNRDRSNQRRKSSQGNMMDLGNFDLDEDY